MIYLTANTSAFEFVVIASLRAKQLIAGCVPRVVPCAKLTTTAAAEVLAGKVPMVLPDVPAVRARSGGL